VGTAADDSSTAAPLEFAFEVQYLLEADDHRVPALRQRLGSLGDSVVVVGGGELYNVHVHTDDPGGAIEEGIAAGRPRGIRVVSLDRQVVGTCVAEEARAVRVGEAGPAPTSGCGLVAVVPGEGTARLFRSLGADVVSGGAGSNPSVGELLDAIAGAHSDTVVLLPNHGNVVPAAEQAARRSEKDVSLIPTRSVPEGLAAATAFNPDAGREENVDRAREAAGRVVSIEVAQASRDARTAAGPVAKGDFLGMSGGEVRAVGADPIRVAVEVLRPLVAEEHEVLTVLTGDWAGLHDGQRAADALTEAFPALEVEVHAGGQPHYPLVIGLE
jgi:dihydroxyacetone kinase-like predicted kinase